MKMGLLIWRNLIWNGVQQNTTTNMEQEWKGLAKKYINIRQMGNWLKYGHQQPNAAEMGLVKQKCLIVVMVDISAIQGVNGTQ